MASVRTPSLDVEAAIIGAAKELLATQGPEALTIRRIASQAGVAPMSVYNRFGSKQGVVDALFVEGFQRLNEAVRFEATEDVEEDLVQCGRRYRRFALENPTLYSVMFLRAVPDYEPSPEAGVIATASFLTLMAGVTPHLDNGRIEQAEPVEIAQRLWSAMHGSIALEISGIGFVEDLDGAYDRMARTVARGLMARAPQVSKKRPTSRPSRAAT